MVSRELSFFKNVSPSTQRAQTILLCALCVLCERSFSIIRNRLAVVAIGEQSERTRIDVDVDGSNVPVAEGELHNVRVVTAKGPAQLGHGLGERILGAGGAAGADVVIAVVHGTIPPADAELAERDMLLTYDDGVAEAVEDVREANSLASKLEGAVHRAHSVRQKVEAGRADAGGVVAQGARVVGAARWAIAGHVAGDAGQRIARGGASRRAEIVLEGGHPGDVRLLIVAPLQLPLREQVVLFHERQQQDRPGGVR